MKLVVFSHALVCPVDRGWLTKNRVGSVVDDLANRGWDVTLVGRLGAPQTFLTYRLRPRIRVVPVAGLLDNAAGWRSWLAAARAARQADAALVFMPTLRNAAVAAMLGRRTVLYAGNTWSALPGFARWRSVVERIAARRAGHVIVAGDAVQRRFQGVARSLTTCAPMVPNEVRAALRGASDDHKQYTPLRALFVGTIVERKGVAELIEALHALPELEARIIGPINDQALGARLRAIAAERDSIAISDYVEWPDLREAYRWANLLVLPSHAEGFPRVVYEASAFGLALLVTPVGGIPHRLRDGKDALFVRPGDANALIQALKEMGEHPGQLQSLANNGRQALAPVFAGPDSPTQFDLCLREVTRRQRIRSAS